MTSSASPSPDQTPQTSPEQGESDGGYTKEIDETESLTRGGTGPLGRITFYLCVAFALIHLYFNTFSTMSELWTSALHFGMFGLLCALIFPLAPVRGAGRKKVILAIDIVLGLAAVGCAFYLIANETALYARGVSFTTGDWIAAFIAVGLAIEFTRRTTGWIIPALIVISLTYVVSWGQWIGGIFSFPGLSLETLMFRSYFGGEGMFGPVARISWTFVFMFILFGAFLVKSGAGEFIIRLAQAAVGRMIGGPGLVAVVGSGLMGSVSGSAVANTVSTGVITIPLMKKAGFPARFAGGVEAAASTGGQLMPPVMGAGAFIMANFTGISYLEIIAVSVLPAILYFLSVAFFVRMEARRQNILPDADQQESLWQVLKEGWRFLVPLVVLVTLLVEGFTPTYAAGGAIVTVVVTSWFSKQRMGPKEVLEALAQGARNVVSVAVLLVAIGLIVNVISTTGVGNTFSLMINQWAGGSLLITLVLIALASLVLGMGLPVTAAYIVLATLSAPAIYDLIAQAQLVEQIANGQVSDMGRALLMLVAPDKLELIGQPMPVAEAQALVALLPPESLRQMIDSSLDPATLTAILLSAHLIIFWLSQDSNVTPPVCLTAFAAATIAGSRPMATGMTAWKIAKGIYIVPLLFAYTPLIGGEPLEVAQVFCFAIVGIYAIAGALQGYLEGPLNPVWRLLLLAAGITMLYPHDSLWIGLGALAVLITIFVITREAPAKTAPA